MDAMSKARATVRIPDENEQAARLSAMSDALAAYEAEFGAISDEEARVQIEYDRANAIQIRPGRMSGPHS